MNSQGQTITPGFQGGRLQYGQMGALVPGEGKPARRCAWSGADSNYDASEGSSGTIASQSSAGVFAVASADQSVTFSSCPK